MSSLGTPHRWATAADAEALAALVNIAGEGLPLYLWTRMAGAGESPWQVGRQRAQRERGSFSYRNAIVREECGAVAACLMGYPLHDTTSPVDTAETPPMFVPLQELECLAWGTWYINVLASFPEYRGRGFGSALLGIAADQAVSKGCRGLSLIVSNANRGALRLYKRSGYREQATRAIVREGWEHSGTEWLLLVKPI
ncbi:MAG TPA: GNAT family N-acetyltransferase [Woeseiaceae bacterium]